MPPLSLISGCRKPSVNAVTTPVKAAPMTTATASSMTLPREMKSRNPLSTEAPYGRYAPSASVVVLPLRVRKSRGVDGLPEAIAARHGVPAEKVHPGPEGGANHVHLLGDDL